MLVRHVMLVFAGLLTVQGSLWAIDPMTRKERIKQLEVMSKVERDRFDRNVQFYQSLTPDQKARLSRLHDELAADQAAAGGLTPLMDAYLEWFAGLSPQQQEEIRRETDPAKKQQVVKRIKEEAEHLTTGGEKSNEFEAPSTNLRMRGVLSGKDLSSVMKAITDRLPSERMQPEFERPQLESYLPILNASVRLSMTPREWPDDTLFQKMLGAIRDKETSLVITRSSSKRDAMIRSILAGIWQQVLETVHFPTEDERLDVFQSLSAVDREQLLGLSPEGMTRQLNHRYFEAKGENPMQKLPGIRRQLLEQFDQLGVQPPPTMRSRRTQAGS